MASVTPRFPRIRRRAGPLRRACFGAPPSSRGPPWASCCPRAFGPLAGPSPLLPSGVWVPRSGPHGAPPFVPSGLLGPVLPSGVWGPLSASGLSLPSVVWDPLFGAPPWGPSGSRARRPSLAPLSQAPGRACPCRSSVAGRRYSHFRHQALALRQSSSALRGRGWRAALDGGAAAASAHLGPETLQRRSRNQFPSRQARLGSGAPRPAGLRLARDPGGGALPVPAFRAVRSLVARPRCDLLASGPSRLSSLSGSSLLGLLRRAALPWARGRFRPSSTKPFSAALRPPRPSSLFVPSSTKPFLLH